MLREEKSLCINIKYSQNKSYERKLQKRPLTKLSEIPYKKPASDGHPMLGNSLECYQ